jgi:threonine/homoserine/homoserine lactone efflux protein
MLLETYIALTLFAFSASVTPGPNNLMLLASGVNFGFRRTIPHLLGIQLGFASLILAVGLGLGSLFSAYPPLHLILKVLGGGYLLWIAYKIARTREMGEASEDARPLSFTQAALFQFVNPKAWVMSVGAVAAFGIAEHYVRDAFLVCLAFLSVGIFCTSIWAAFGTVLKGWLAKPGRLKWFNIAMALLLVASLWPMLK